MTQLEFQRRPSYGPSSPTVGERGARTRMQISQAALECFTTKGYHGTSVDDIAKVAGISRATLYQYFESKDAVFIDLMIDSGTALANELRRIERLGPDAAGYHELHRWLTACIDIYDTYAPMFIEWANVNTTTTPLGDEVAGYVDFHVDHFSALLRDAGVSPAEADVASVVVLGIYTRFNYIRHVYRPGPSDRAHLDSLANALQLFLFPSTPIEVLSGTDAAPEPEDARPPVTRMGPLASLSDTAAVEPFDPFEGVSDQSAGTVRQLLDAAGRVFAAHGYHAANIDHIVTEAGLARGTFYRYFTEKVELINVLSQEAVATMRPLFEEFERFGKERDPAALRDWLRRFLAAQRTYAGVMRSWTEGLPVDPTLMVGAVDIVAAMSGAVAATFGPERPYPLDRRAAGMLLSSLLEHVPNEGAGARHEPSDDALIEAQATFIERVIFPD